MRRRSESASRPPFLLLLALLALPSVPAAGYIVFLKDGSQIQTKEKYRIEGDRAILVLPSGTEAFYDASEIDVEKTAEVNVVEYGTATLIEGGETQQLASDTRFEDDEEELGELLVRRGQGLALPEPRRRRQAAAATDGGPPTTPAGFLDLTEWKRKPHPDAELAAELASAVEAQGFEAVRVFAGTAADRALVEIVTASEVLVFKALRDAASVLGQIEERSPGRLAAIELLLVTEAGQRGGQFLLTPELAADLAGGKLSPATFFLRYVEF